MREIKWTGSRKSSWGGWGVWGRICAMPSGGPIPIFDNFTTVCESNEFQFTRVGGPYPLPPPLLYPYMAQKDFFVWLNFESLSYRVGALNWPLLHRGGPIPAARVTTQGEVAVVTVT